MPVKNGGRRVLEKVSGAAPPSPTGKQNIGASHSATPEAKSNVLASPLCRKARSSFLADMAIATGGVAALVALIVAVGILADHIPTWVFPASALCVLAVGVVSLLAVDR